ncbi:MAG: SDR family oxidoreductase [Devosiaceae bacterium]|nr:SDR family oxidoreductase [Devosiaceae bacterium]
MTGLAIITGGGRGIGASTALKFAKAGYDVCINYTANKSSAHSVAKQCRACGVKSEIFQADVADPQIVRKMFEFCDENFFPLAVLVNNAGIIGTATTVEKLSAPTLKDTFGVNVFGAFYCAQEAIKRMSRENAGNGGVIINISSIAATNGSPNEYVHYAASKAALDGMTNGLAKEVGPLGIRVCSVQAGTVNTDIHAKTGNPDRPAMVAATSPLRRVGVPGDIAEAVFWLASDKAQYATGTILRVGGGL